MILFINDLTVIDSSYLSEERGMVGESYIVDLEIEGSLNRMSMILDFGRVKKQAKELIDRVLDHKLIVPAGSKGVTLKATEGNLTLDFAYTAGSLHTTAPESAFALIPFDEVNAYNLTRFLEEALMAIFPDNIMHVRVCLRTENIRGAYYHYSHGLKKHDGNCQRIAHGHRSKIEIFKDGTRDEQLEKAWAAAWQDIYLGSESDLADMSQLPLSDEIKSHIRASHQLFHYHAGQGAFFLAMPAANTCLLPCDTTIECLADYIVKTLKTRFPDSSFTVVAYEGVKKGAKASA